MQVVAVSTNDVNVLCFDCSNSERTAIWQKTCRQMKTVRVLVTVSDDLYSHIITVATKCQVKQPKASYSYDKIICMMKIK